MPRTYDFLAIERGRYKVIPAALKNIHPEPIVCKLGEDYYAGSVSAGAQRLDHFTPRAIGEFAICKDDLDLMVNDSAQALDKVLAPKETPTGTQNRIFQGSIVPIIGRSSQNTHGGSHSGTRKTLNHSFACLFLLLGIQISPTEA